MGARRAAAVLLQNRALSASEALGLGIVDQVVPDADGDTVALDFAARIAAGARGAYAGIKSLLAASPGSSLDEQLDAEAASIAARAGSPEGREGIAAFSQRRSPDFPATRS